MACVGVVSKSICSGSVILYLGMVGASSAVIKMCTSLALLPWLYWEVCKCCTSPFFITFPPLHCWINSFRLYTRWATAHSLVYKHFLSSGFLWFSYLEYYFLSCPVLPRHLTLYFSFIVPSLHFVLVLLVLFVGVVGFFSFFPSLTILHSKIEFGVFLNHPVKLSRAQAPSSSILGAG